jgi:hypothetical protein
MWTPSPLPVVLVGPSEKSPFGVWRLEVGGWSNFCFFFFFAFLLFPLVLNLLVFLVRGMNWDLNPSLGVFRSIGLGLYYGKL